MTIARADVVGSVLRPAYLRQARQAARGEHARGRGPARDLGPLRHVRPETEVVLGLLTSRGLP